MLFWKTPPVGLALLPFSITLFSCSKQPSYSAPQQTHSLAQSQAKPSSDNRVEQIAPDLKVDFLMDGRTHMPFVALDAPQMVRAAEADFLNEHEYVLGITGGGESRAYPDRFLTFHHVINDTLGTPAGAARPVAITYCNVCNAGICYDPVVHGKTLKFNFFGIYNGVVALCERQTQGVFLLAEGRIVSGPLTGTRLKTVSCLDTTWGAWKRLHPDTLVMSPQTPFARYYGSPMQPVQRGAKSFPIPYFKASVTRGDKRLPPFETVLAVTLMPNGNHAQQPPLHRAYPLLALERAGGVVNDTVGNVPVGVLLDKQTQTAAALSRRLGTQTLTFAVRQQGDGTTAFYDRETGTLWNLEGEGEEGPLQGKTVERLDYHLSQWYGWAASFPDTSLYGRSGPPQPGNPFEEERSDTSHH
jgi:hypothetical protein